MAKKNKTKSDGSVLVYLGTPGKKKAKKSNSVLLPVSPEKINYKFKNQNKTLRLVNGEEINMILPKGLTEITMDKVLLPNKAYTFCFKNSNKEVWSAAYLMKLFEELKASSKPFPLAINASSDGLCNDGYSESWLVTLENYSVVRSTELNNDLEATLTFKEHVKYGVQKVKIKADDTNTSKETTKNKKSRTETKEQSEEQTYTVKSGDTLWSISKKFYGDGSLYPYLASLNGLKNPNVLQVGQVLKIGPQEEAEKYKGTSSGSSKSTSTNTNKSTTKTTSGSDTTQKSSTDAFYLTNTLSMLGNAVQKYDEATQKLIDNLSSDVCTNEYGGSPFGPNYNPSYKKYKDYTYVQDENSDAKKRAQNIAIGNNEPGSAVLVQYSLEDSIKDEWKKEFNPLQPDTLASLETYLALDKVKGVG